MIEIYTGRFAKEKLYRKVLYAKQLYKQRLVYRRETISYK